MSADIAVIALRRYNQNRSATKKEAVRAAVAQLAADPGQPINKSAVARRAGVSREFINSHPELRRLIETAARQARDTPLPQHHDDTTIRGLQAQNRTFAQQISHQKTLVTELRSTQLMASAVDPEIHAQLQLDHDRLVAEYGALQRRLGERDRLIAVLQDDLASRQAHADDIARLTADTTARVAVIRHQP